MFMARGGPRLRTDSSSPTLLTYRGLRGLRGWRALALAVAALALAACSAVRLGYNHADTYVLYSLNDYLDLSDEQEALARQRASALLAWHRETQLRDYAAFIEASRARLEGPITANDVIEFNQALNARLIAIGDRVAPDLAQLALSLKPEQIDRLEKRFVESTVKARRELVRATARESLDERVQKTADRAEYWFGALSRLQLDAVRTSLASRPSADDWWIGERERRQRGLIVLLRRIQSERPEVDVAARWIRAYFAQIALPAEPEGRAQLDAFRRGNADLIAQLVNRATPEQRAMLSRKLSGFAQDFVALAAQGGSG
jgi:hypothetical protein